MNLHRPITPKKFDEIKTYFTINLSSNLNTKNILKKKISHRNFIVRPKLSKISNKLHIKKRELSNMLEQIGKEDVIFNDDKLITNIKIETIEDSLAHNDMISQDTDKSFISKRTAKTNSSLVNLRKNIRKKKYLKQNRNKNKDIEIDNNTLELNCNKMPYANDISKLSFMQKKQNRSKQSSKNKIHKIKLKNKNNMCIKNVNQFINKPTEGQKKGNINLLISPLSKQSPIKHKYNKKLIRNHDFHASQEKLLLGINNNDSMSLVSHTKNELSKSFIHGKSLQIKQPNYMHFPSKSIIKNQEKVIIELQKLFGDKLQLNNETYKNMTDLDKINSINFLLETIKEMNNINKSNKSKIDSYKELNENKEKLIKEQKTEIKGLKKEIHKLNKLIKTNIQINKKLEQNIDTLKTQLEKEKEKNKSSLKERGKSTSKSINSYFNLKLKTDKNINKNKHKKTNRSQEILQKANIFINREKNENKNINENNVNKNINQNNINVKTNINIIIKNKEEKNEDKTEDIKEEKKEEKKEDKKGEKKEDKKEDKKEISPKESKERKDENK